MATDNENSNQSNSLKLTKRHDSEIEVELRESFARSPEIKIEGLAIRVSDGQVTLEGHARDQIMIQRATEVASRTKHVKQVSNQIGLNDRDEDLEDARASQRATDDGMA